MSYKYYPIYAITIRKSVDFYFLSDIISETKLIKISKKDKQT